jgi:hypothetical protein
MVDKSEPMDAAAPERAQGEPATNNLRGCHAAKQLVLEVLDLFPETVWNFNTYNGRNVGLGVDFLAEEDGLVDLLVLLGDSAHNGDPRITSVEVEDGNTVKVRFRNNPRTYDLRDPFGLSEAWIVLGEDATAGDPGYGPEDADLDGAAPDYGDDSKPVEGGSAAKTSEDVLDGGGA